MAKLEDHLLFLSGGAPLIASERDFFDYPDATLVGNGWTNFSEDVPSTYTPVGVRDGILYCPDSFNVPDWLGYADYAAFLAAPPAVSTWFGGIGGIYRDFDTTDVTVRLGIRGCQDWNPLHDFYGIGHGLEQACLVHVTPSEARYGFGVWHSALAPTGGLLLIGYIGNPPSSFEIVAYSVFTHDYVPHEMELTSIGGEAFIKYDGRLIQMYEIDTNDPISTVTVDPALASSTNHGLAVDIHYDPDPNARLVDWFQIFDES